VSRLSLRQFDREGQQILSGTEGAMFPFWSPDSRAVAFFAEGKLKRIDLDSGHPVTVAEAPSGRGGAWTENGQIVFAADVTGGLSRVSADGGSPAPFTSLASGETSHRMPFTLPGDRIGYFAMTTDAAESGVRVTSLARPTPVRVLRTSDAAQFAAGFLFFVRDETLLAQQFDLAQTRLTGKAIPVAQGVLSSGSGATSVPALSVSKDGSVVVRRTRPSRTELTMVSRDGRSVVPLKLQAGALGQPELSPDGTRLAYLDFGRVSRYGELWTLDLVRGTTTRAQITGPGLRSPLWTSDGQRLVVGSPRGMGGNQNLYEVAAGGGELTPVFEAPAGLRAAGWVDQQLCVIQADAPPVAHFQIVGGGRPNVEYFAPHTSIGAARVSPHGDAIAFTSTQSGHPEVYLIGYPNAGAITPVSKEGGRQPRWRQDGQELFYLAASGKLMAVTVRREGAAVQLGAPLPLVSVRTALSVSQYDYDVTPDGRQFVVSVEQRPSVDEVQVILNWAGQQ
jgi:Tol biopolymer transport system component